MADSPLEGDYGQAEEGTTRELDPAEEQPQKAAKDSSWYKETAAQEGSKDSVAPAEAQEARALPRRRQASLPLSLVTLASSMRRRRRMTSTGTTARIKA